MVNRNAFSLIEVVIAVGVFAVGIVTVVTLLGPMGSSMRAVTDESSADRIINLVDWGLRTYAFEELESAEVPSRYFAPKDGSSFGAASSSDSFFEIEMQRNTADPENGVMLLFDVFVTWPLKDERGTSIPMQERKALYFVTAVNR